MTPWPVLVGVMAPVAGRLSDRYSPGLLGGIGLMILAAGLVDAAAHAGRAHPRCDDRLAHGRVRRRLRLLPGAQREGDHEQRARRTRSGSASGMVATARLIGQSTGAALVAFCLTMSTRARQLVRAGDRGRGFAFVGQRGQLFAAAWRRGASAASLLACPAHRHHEESSTMTRVFRIAAIAGDGIGKEVLPEGLKVLEAAAERFGLQLEFNHFPGPAATGTSRPAR